MLIVFAGIRSPSHITEKQQ